MLLSSILEGLPGSVNSAAGGHVCRCDTARGEHVSGVGFGRVIPWPAERLEDVIVNPGKINGYPPGELAEPCGATVRGTIRD